jgi:hypothetical protein
MRQNFSPRLTGDSWMRFTQEFTELLKMELQLQGAGLTSSLLEIPS